MMKRLLIVEDQETMRGVLAAAAREAGFAVTLAANGQIALDMCKTQDIHAILSDLNMPVMDGEQFIRALRAAGLAMPVIMVTAVADQEKVRALIQLGISGYIVKPFKMDAVQQALEKLHQRL
ncbi:MAG TPA: response regulator [Azospira sp.]|nr:response regulator [Azospira sp.]